jgi:mRNA interferase MazF
MPTHRGDVVLVLFPDSSLRTAKRRPALVVQADNLQTKLAQSIVAMGTSKMPRAGHRSRITVKRDGAEGKRAGLLTDSVIMTDNLVTVRDGEIDRTISRYPDLGTIDACLRHTFGLR